MKQIYNNFIFFGAVHQDFVFELKNHLIKFRTNLLNIMKAMVVLLIMLQK